MSIETNLRKLIDSKEQIRQAIITKGVDVSESIKIDGYAEKILEIEQGGSVEMQHLDVAYLGTYTNTEKPYSSVTVSDTYFYAKQTDEEGNVYIINSKGEKIVTDERETPPTPVVGGNVRWKGIDEVWHEDYYEDGIIPTQKYKGKADILEVEIGEGITEVGKSAFSACTNIAKLSISDTVTSIEESAFDDCSGFTDVIIPSGVTEIKISVFAGCRSLTSVTFDDSVTSIGTYAFAQCLNLKRMNSYVDGVFNIPNSVTSISGGAFQYCTNLTSIEIPSGVTSIGAQTFYNCSGLTNVEIPNSVTNIGDNSFFFCTNLTNIEIPNLVTSIGKEALAGCWSLTNVTIHKYVTSIGSGAFGNVPTQGTFYCDENWYNKLTYTMKTNLGNIYNWEKSWI